MDIIDFSLETKHQHFTAHLKRLLMYIKSCLVWNSIGIQYRHLLLSMESVQYKLHVRYRMVCRHWPCAQYEQSIFNYKPQPQLLFIHLYLNSSHRFSILKKIPDYNVHIPFFDLSFGPVPSGFITKNRFKWTSLNFWPGYVH